MKNLLRFLGWYFVSAFALALTLTLFVDVSTAIFIGKVGGAAIGAWAVFRKQQQEEAK